MRFQSQGNLWMFADSYIEKKCPNFGQSLDLSGGGLGFQFVVYSMSASFSPFSIHRVVNKSKGRSKEVFHTSMISRIVIILTSSTYIFSPQPVWPVESDRTASSKVPRNQFVWLRRSVETRQKSVHR